MTETTTTSSTRSPKISPPTDRDLEIFRHTDIYHRTHDAVSLDFHISRRRVGQIVQDVRRWLALHGTTNLEINSDAQRQRQARGLERMRLLDIIQRAVHALNNAPHALTTSFHIEGICQSKFVRDQPPVDHRILKTYLQAVLALGKLEERKPLPAPPPAYEPCTDPKIQAFLNDWCQKNRIQWESPEEYQHFVEQLTHTIRDGLADSIPAEGSPPTPSGTDAAQPLDLDNDSWAGQACDGPPSALPSASPASLPEAPPANAPADSLDAPTAYPADTSNPPPAVQHSSVDANTPPQKTEKGSASIPLTAPHPSLNLEPGGLNSSSHAPTLATSHSHTDGASPSPPPITLLPILIAEP